jgi:methylated-DNA-[protein]-cysteine S-methyltransferase
MTSKELFPTEVFSTDFSASADELTILKAKLAASAAEDHLLDVSYRIIDSPVGSLLLAATENGLVRLAFANEDHDAVLQSLANTISPRILAASPRLEKTARQLDDYFGGTRRTFDVAVDLRLAKGFRRSVLEKLTSIRYGETASYATLAGLTENPKAVRAAAGACSHNPLPLVLPCHRIVRSDGTIGQYLGGTDAKRFLLNLERAA